MEIKENRWSDQRFEGKSLVEDEISYKICLFKFFISRPVFKKNVFCWFLKLLVEKHMVVNGVRFSRGQINTVSLLFNQQTRWEDVDRKKKQNQKTDETKRIKVGAAAGDCPREELVPVPAVAIAS